MASHARSAASFRSGYFAGGMYDPSSLCMSCPTHSDPIARPVQFAAGAPATIPSKSAGYRCASISPCRPPLEQLFQYASRAALP
jgi:hypothetical protein